MGLLAMALFCLTQVLPAWAQEDYEGSPNVAHMAGKVWPEPIDGTAEFDRASRAVILVYMVELQAAGQLSDARLREQTGVKYVGRASVNKWMKQEMARAEFNYRQAAANCEAGDWTCIPSHAHAGRLLPQARVALHAMPYRLRPWRERFRRFAQDYLAEQLRLAALFPKVNSEIRLFNDNEWNGDSLPDRQFFLSFDDGPTGPNGSTDRILAMLRGQGKTATFFVLGESFNTRLEQEGAAHLRWLYRKQCVGSHGWKHDSHAKWQNWRESVRRTQKLLRATLPTAMVQPVFRPPYGQRRKSSEAFFRGHSLQVGLWDLDSEDWNPQLNAPDVANRVLLLMLLKRHGVLLFHDIHPKALRALPVIFRATGGAVVWGECRDLPGAAGAQQISRSNGS